MPGSATSDALKAPSLPTVSTSALAVAGSALTRICVSGCAVPLTVSLFSPPATLLMAILATGGFSVPISTVLLSEAASP